MVESRWLRRAGPGVVALGAVALVALGDAGRAGTPWVPPAVCADDHAGPVRAGSGDVVPARSAARGRASLARPATGPRRRRPGPPAVDGAAMPESFAAGPFGGRVLVGTDDGTRPGSRSSIRPAAAPRRSASAARRHPPRDARARPGTPCSNSGSIGGPARTSASGDARSAIPATRRRRSCRPIRARRPVRADLVDGVRRGATTVAALAVQSCGEVACRTRVVDLGDRPRPRWSPDPELGELVGLDRESPGRPRRLPGIALPARTRSPSPTGRARPSAMPVRRP